MTGTRSLTHGGLMLQAFWSTLVQVIAWHLQEKIADPTLADNILKCIFWNERIRFEYEYYWNVFPLVQWITSQFIRCLIIIGTSNALVYWRIYTVLGLSELTKDCLFFRVVLVYSYMYKCTISQNRKPLVRWPFNCSVIKMLPVIVYGSYFQNLGLGCVLS